MWYIIRHGETLENRFKIQQGQTNSLLTLKGIDQAKSIAYRLLELEKDVAKFKFITSPTIRTRHTLQIIMEILNVEESIRPIIEPLIEGQDKGIFNNVSKEKIKDLYSEEFLKKQQDPWNYIIPGSKESKTDVAKRLQKFIEKYKNEKNLIIIGHKGINIMLKLLLINNDIEFIKQCDKKVFDGSQNYFYSWNKEEFNKL